MKSAIWYKTVLKLGKRKGGHRMSDWSIIPTRALIEAEDLLSDIADNRDFVAIYLKTIELRKLINEGMPCNVKPEGTK